MCVLCKWHAIVGLHVSVRSENVTQYFSCRSKPRTSTFPKNASKHVSSAGNLQVHFGSYTFAYDANSILLRTNFTKLVAHHSLRKTTFALKTRFAFGFAIFWCFTITFLVLGMPMMLHSAKDKLNVRLELLLELGSIFSNAIHHSVDVFFAFFPR